MLPPELRSRATLEKKRVEVTKTLERAMVRKILTGIAPLREAGKLGALLLQLSPGFSPKKHRLEEIDHLIELLDGYPLAVELRNRGWLTDRAKETEKFFQSRKVIFVMVDGPDDPHFTVAPSLDLITHPHMAYLRAHGRNAQGYIRGRTVPERFDYAYPKKELQQIAGRAVNAAKQVGEVHVIYNNNKADYAPRAATMFQTILEEKHPETLPDASHESAPAVT